MHALGPSLSTQGHIPITNAHTCSTKETRKNVRSYTLGNIQKQTNKQTKKKQEMNQMFPYSGMDKLSYVHPKELLDSKENEQAKITHSADKSHKQY